MYDVIFSNEWAQTNKNYVRLTIAELERALALASILQKISTPEVKFEGVIVQPHKSEENETEKK